MTIYELIAQGEEILKTKTYSDFGYAYVNKEQKIEWEQIGVMFLQVAFHGNPRVSEFEELCCRASNCDHRLSTFLQQLSILKAFAIINPSKGDTDCDTILSNVFNRFQQVARQLTRRHDGRETLRIKDEYDVQYLLHALLKLHFDDVRAEENVPSNAGSSKRLDFLLNDEQVVVEVKMTRDKLRDKEVGDQLKIDIASYKAHPKCKKIYCFVYDHDGLISNPRGIEKDLEALSTDDVAVKVFIRPE